jgi:hypothetical protein
MPAVRRTRVSLRSTVGRGQVQDAVAVEVANYQGQRRATGLISPGGLERAIAVAEVNLDVAFDDVVWLVPCPK